MAPTPLIATHRLTFLYTADGFQHKQENYCAAVPSGDSSGYDLVGRGSGHDVGVSGLANAFFAQWADAYTPGLDTFDGWELYENVSGTFILLAAGTTTVVPTGSGGPWHALMYAITGKDANNRNLPTYMYEGQFGTSNKQSSYASLNASAKGKVDQQYNVGGVGGDDDPYNWRMSRGNARPFRWLAVVTDSNEKLRRLRRIK